MKRTFFISILVVIFIISIVGYTSYQKSKVPLFPIVQDGKHGFIDKKGNYVINPRFDDVGFFSDGLCGVKIGDKWGFIDKKGNYVINPRFDDVGFFSDDLVM